MYIALSLLHEKLALKRTGDYPKLPSRSENFGSSGVEQVFLTNKEKSDFLPLFIPVDKTGKEVSNLDKEFYLLFRPSEITRPVFIDQTRWDSFKPCYLCKTLSRSYYLNALPDPNRVLVTVSSDSNRYALMGTEVESRSCIVRDYHASKNSFAFDEKITFEL